MKYLLLILLALSFQCQAQIPISDMSNLPVAPVVYCDTCNPYDRNDPEVQKGVMNSAEALLALCVRLGENQWGHESNIHNCAKGQFHMVNGWGDFATYLYVWYENQINFGILYYGTNDSFRRLTPAK